MNWPSHVAYPFLLANALAFLVGIHLTPAHAVLVIIASMLPDFDYAFYFLYCLVSRKRFDPFVNHHLWASHWPISYVPLLALLALFPSLEMGILVGGVALHLVMDSFYCSFGVMWGYPFKKRPVNINPLKAQDNLVWLRKWSTTRLAWAERVAMVAVLLMVVF